MNRIARSRPRAAGVDSAPPCVVNWLGATAMIQASAKAMTYKSFLRAYEGRHAEWVDGEAILMTPATWSHQEIVMFLSGILGLYLRRRPVGKICLAPYQMRLASAKSGREPDLLFVASEHLARAKDSHLEGPADVAVEVISPESRKRDTREKFEEYERAGVREYWLIDPKRRKAEFFAISAGGRYAPIAPGAAGELRSRAIEGFWLDPLWLWERPLPDPVEVLARWGLN